MLKFQETNYFKGICIFLALSIFNLSCQSSYQAADCNPISLPIQYDDAQSLSEDVHFALDIATTMQRLDNYSSIGEAFSTLFEDDQNTAHLAATFTNEYEESESLGLNNYLDSKVNSGILSANLVVELKKLFIDIEDFTNQNPTIESYLDFLEAQKNNTLLCSSDSQFFNGYIDMAISIVSYFYPIGSDALKDPMTSELRGCNWWQNILCISLAVVVFAITFLVVGEEILTPIIFGADVVKYNDITLNESQKEDLLLLLAFVGSFVVAFYAYDLCCPDSGIPEQECQDPTGAVLYSTGCDEHRYVITGPSEYAATQWNNANTIPSNVTTIRAELNFNLETFGDPSQFVALVSCIANANEVELYDWEDELTVSYSPLPVGIEWAYTPPSTAQLFTSYEVATTQGSAENLELTWSVTPTGGAVSSTGPYSGKLTFFTSGTKIVKATLTDICTGESKSVSKSVNVN